MSKLELQELVKNIRIKISRADNLRAITNITTLLEKLTSQEYERVLNQVSDQQRDRIQRERLKIAGTKQDTQITLGQWIGIFRKSGIFTRFYSHCQFFEPQKLDEINCYRNRKVHKLIHAETDSVEWAYVYLINTLQELKYDIPQNIHNLCETCKESIGTLSKKNKRHICKFCLAEEKFLKDKIEHHKSEVLKNIFEIRTMVAPDSLDDLTKFMTETDKRLLEILQTKVGEEFFTEVREIDEEPFVRLEPKKTTARKHKTELEKKAIKKLHATQTTVFNRICAIIQERIDYHTALFEDEWANFEGIYALFKEKWPEGRDLVADIPKTLEQHYPDLFRQAALYYCVDDIMTQIYDLFRSRNDFHRYFFQGRYEALGRSNALSKIIELLKG